MVSLPIPIQYINLGKSSNSRGAGVASDLPALASTSSICAVMCGTMNEAAAPPWPGMHREACRKAVSNSQGACTCHCVCCLRYCYDTAQPRRRACLAILHVWCTGRLAVPARNGPACSWSSSSLQSVRSLIRPLTFSRVQRQRQRGAPTFFHRLPALQAAAVELLRLACACKNHLIHSSAARSLIKLSPDPPPRPPGTSCAQHRATQIQDTTPPLTVRPTLRL